MIYLSDRTITVRGFGEVNLFSLTEGRAKDVSRRKRLFVTLGLISESIPFGFVGVVYRVKPCTSMERSELYKNKIEGVIYRDVRGDYTLMKKDKLIQKEAISDHEEWIKAELQKSRKGKGAKPLGGEILANKKKGAKRGKKQ